MELSFDDAIYKLTKYRTTTGKWNTRLVSTIETRDKELHDVIVGFTSYMTPNASISQRLYHFQNRLMDYPRCSNGEPLRYVAGKGYPKGRKCDAKYVPDASLMMKARMLKHGKINDKFKADVIATHGPGCIDDSIVSLKRHPTPTQYQNALWMSQHHREGPHKIIGGDWSKVVYDLSNNIVKDPICTCCGIKLGYDRSRRYSTLCKDKTCKNTKNVRAHSRIAGHHLVVSNHLLNSGFALLSDYALNDGRPHHIRCNTCAKEFVRHIHNGNWIGMWCPHCYPNESKPQAQLHDYIKTTIPEIQTYSNDRSLINPFELDIIIPAKQFAIEMNGIWWHCDEHNRINEHYHLNKTIQCDKIGYQLLHIWDLEWFTKQEIVKSIISSKLGTSSKVFARKTHLMQIDSKCCNQFLNQCHIQGGDSSSIRYGLVREDILVAVMTFGKRKITGSTHIEWELMRYCSLLGTTVIGGASKLFNQFIKDHNPQQVVSYADRRFSNGNLYYKLGFTLSHISKPNYWYIKNSRMWHRASFMKHTLSDKLEAYDPSLTEKENMNNHGYNRVYDCGSYVFRYTKA